MMQHRHPRTWLWIAAIAIVAAVVLLLVPHAHSANDGAFAAIVPLLFVGVISPLSLLSPLAFLYIGHTPEAPARPASFQRPPPFGIA
jgi:hypothetical protein